MPASSPNTHRGFRFSSCIRSCPPTIQPGSPRPTQEGAGTISTAALLGPQAQRCPWERQAPLARHLPLSRQRPDSRRSRRLPTDTPPLPHVTRSVEAAGAPHPRSLAPRASPTPSRLLPHGPRPGNSPEGWGVVVVGWKRSLRRSRQRNNGTVENTRGKGDERLSPLTNLWPVVAAAAALFAPGRGGRIGRRDTQRLRARALSPRLPPQRPLRGITLVALCPRLRRVGHRTWAGDNGERRGGTVAPYNSQPPTPWRACPFSRRRASIHTHARLNVTTGRSSFARFQRGGATIAGSFQAPPPAGLLS